MFGDSEKTAGSLGYYPNQLTKIAQEESLSQKLAYHVAKAEQQLKDAKRAQEILEKSPELEELINIMQRQRYL